MAGFVEATPSGNGGLFAGMQMADMIQKKRRENERLKGLASGFLKVRAGDESGWDEMANADPTVAMNMWKEQQDFAQREKALKQKEFEKQFNTTNERKNAEYLISKGWDPEKAINIAFKVNQNPSQTLSPYEKTAQMEQAKNMAEIEQKANALEANIPAFEAMAKDLNEIGKDVSYTTPQKAIDWIVRQSGSGSTKGASARERYKQIVSNELLPKLRETFGGQLSDAERESLLSTLGNVDLAPEEREQAVKSFIESKKRQLDGYKRQLGIKTDDKKPTKEEAIAELRRRGVIR